MGWSGSGSGGIRSRCNSRTIKQQKAAASPVLYNTVRNRYQIWCQAVAPSYSIFTIRRSTEHRADKRNYLEDLGKAKSENGGNAKSGKNKKKKNKKKEKSTRARWLGGSKRKQRGNENNGCIASRFLGGGRASRFDASRLGGKREGMKCCATHNTVGCCATATSYMLLPRAPHLLGHGPRTPHALSHVGIRAVSSYRGK